MFSFDKFEVEKDKANHFIYGSLITLTSLIFGVSPLLSFLLCTAIAILKEIWDLFYGSGFDWLDIVWTILGSIVVIVSFFIKKT
jgi:hypothetical protein